MADQPERVCILPIGSGWPRLEVALSLIWRCRGMLEGELAEAPERLFPT